MRKQKRMLQVALEKNHLLEQHCKILQQSYASNAELFHDMNHHLQIIYHIANQNGDEEIKQYISNITTPIQELSNYIWTGVEIVDVILNNKKQLAQSKGYAMDINTELPNNTGISSDDYCVILSNLIDNAIEALDRLPKPITLPLIQVSIRRIHQFLMIQVSNPCLDNRKKKHGFFSTSKPNTVRHGWGLKSIKKTVNKYHGSLNCEIKNHTFTATALLFFPINP